MEGAITDDEFVDVQFDGKENIYKVARRIKQKEHTLYNALRSIHEDSLFVREIRKLWLELPLLANLRCGLWYSSYFDGTCYFKSTDGHNGNWSFNINRLNFHVISLAAERGGCIIVDATRKGKRFPDSMSKTIPIWACVLNQALAIFRPHQQELAYRDGSTRPASYELTDEGLKAEDWDTALHLPLWISHVEKASIESHIPSWVEDLTSSGLDLACLSQCLKKPLQPLWISQKSRIWLNEVPNVDSLSFTPIILVSASMPSFSTQQITDGNFSWSYIPGAGDDEESWARGLTPSSFWKHSMDILSSGPSNCNVKVAEIVEQDRVYRALRGFDAPQVRAKSKSVLVGEQPEVVNCLVITDACGMACSHPKGNLDTEMDISVVGAAGKNFLSVNREHCRSTQTSVDRFHWISNTRLAVSNGNLGNIDDLFQAVDSVINCGVSSFGISNIRKGAYLYLPIVGSKFDRYSLQKHLSEAVLFARDKLLKGWKVLIFCENGEDISVCVCLAILLSCFNSTGEFDRSCQTATRSVSKLEVRHCLIYLSLFHSDARPSRGSLKQVFNYLNKG